MIAEAVIDESKFSRTDHILESENIANLVKVELGHPLPASKIDKKFTKRLANRISLSDYFESPLERKIVVEMLQHNAQFLSFIENTCKNMLTDARIIGDNSLVTEFHTLRTVFEEFKKQVSESIIYNAKKIAHQPE